MDDVATIGRVCVSLAAVLGVMWVLARRMRRPSKGRSARNIEVLDRAQLSRTASVAVVRIGGQALVLGVADAHVSVLGETDLATALATRTTPSLTREPKAASAQSAVPAQVEAALAARTARTAAHRIQPQADPAAPAASAVGAAAGPLAGSALSPQTWKQAVESLRDLTTRV